MRARKYNKRIEVWQTLPEAQDEFGDKSVTPQLITTTWCELITTNTVYRSTDMGIIDTTDTITIKLRKRNDLTYNSKNQFFKYRGLKYVIQTEPINVGFEDREIIITLKKEMSKGVDTITPIGNQNQNQNQNQNGQGH